MREKSILNYIKTISFIFIITFTTNILLTSTLAEYISQKREAILLRKNHLNEYKEIIKGEVLKIKARIEKISVDINLKEKENIKKRVYEAQSIAENLYNKFNKTKSRIEIINLIVESLRNIRFNNGNGYYFLQITQK